MITMNTKAKIIGCALALCASLGFQARANETDADSLARAAATALYAAVNQSLENLDDMGLEVDRTKFAQSLYTALTGGETGFTRESAEAYLDKAMREANHIVPDSVTPESQLAYLDRQAQMPGAKRMPSGIIFTTVKEGKGANPTDNDKVSIECYATLSDESVFYQTEEGQPDDYDVTGVIKGFAEGLKMMRKGGTYRVVIPSELAYGKTGIRGVVPGNAALNFLVTVIDITKNTDKK
jgi:FKBP-type peptidyl-prolyl cis-trans isomerase